MQKKKIVYQIEKKIKKEVSTFYNSFDEVKRKDEFRVISHFKIGAIRAKLISI